MALADIYCQPNSAPEPFGIAIAEAMRSGLPCVVSNTGGSAELVDAESAVLTSPRDPIDVAVAIAKLAADPVLRGRMGRAAAARASRLTDPEARLTEVAAALSVQTAPGPVMRHPHRLVCVTTSGALGGAETSLLTLLGALRAIEPAWQMTVVAPAEGPLLERCRAAGIGAVMLPFPAAMAAIGEPANTGAPRPARLRAAFQLGINRSGALAVSPSPARRATAPEGHHRPQQRHQGTRRRQSHRRHAECGWCGTSTITSVPGRRRRDCFAVWRGALRSSS